MDDESCLRVNNRGGKDPYGFVPIWPPDFRLAAEGDDVRILDEGGRLAAKVGEQVRMGGGEATETLGGVDERTARELRERCPGNYWIVGGEVRIP